MTVLVTHIRGFVKEYLKRRHLVRELALRDFRSRYVGSSFGLLWALLQPFAMMSILWAVFSFGLKAGAQDNVGFAVWFFTAMIAWNFFNETLNATTNVYREYSFLVKKMNFRLAILPLVKILSALILHLVFIAIVMVILIANGIAPGWQWLQVFYYLGAMIFLLFGLSWLLSSLNVFSRDVAQVVAIITQFGFWATPIVWNYKKMPENLQFFVKFNPMFYIVEGYRKSLLYKTPLWEESPSLTLYYWGVAALIFILGTVVFKKLKPHFADVL
jgi:lipopolysaccharide transport system permease protein